MIHLKVLTAKLEHFVRLRHDVESHIRCFVVGYLVHSPKGKELYHPAWLQKLGFCQHRSPEENSEIFLERDVGWLSPCSDKILPTYFISLTLVLSVCRALPIRHCIAQIREVSGDVRHPDWWLEWAELSDVARAELSACFSELSPGCCPSRRSAYVWSLPVYPGSDLQQGAINMDRVARESRR